MRLLLGQLAPARGEVDRNLERLEAAVRAARSDLAIFPELFLSGYGLGDRVHALSLRPGDRTIESLRRIARASAVTIVVGAPLALEGRHGEVENVALVVPPDGPVSSQSKRYLPNFGPFEEGLAYTPSDSSRPVEAGGHRIGLEVCYDVFFPEVSRDLALGGAEVLVNISASPVTSRRLFEKLLPARAIENACPVVYVNRVGVEDGFVFGGGTGAWDSRGEPLPLETIAWQGSAADEGLYGVDIDLGASARWRPFRPVLRDVAARAPGRAPSPP
jgi:predicted amidohydrolase